MPGELREQYPNLAVRFNRRTFELIIATIRDHFSDLFDLDILESEAATHYHSSYYSLFEQCINSLDTDKTYTQAEIIAELYLQLQTNSKIRNAFIGKFVLKVSTSERGDKSAADHQLGFLEKMATGKLGVYEPLTMIDMMRMSMSISSERNEGDKDQGVYIKPQMPVFHLKHLSIIKNESLQKFKFVIINLENDATKPAKWAVYFPKLQQLYSEACITPEEKLSLAKKFTNIRYHDRGETTKEVDSSGYTVMAMLEENLKRTQNGLDRDFWTLRVEFQHMMVKPRGVYNRITLAGSEKPYLSPAFKYYLTLTGDPTALGHMPMHHIFRSQSRFTINTFAGSKIKFNPYDIGDFLDKLYSQTVSLDDLKKNANAGERYGMYRFDITMSKYNIDGNYLLQENKDSSKLDIPIEIDLTLLKVHNQETSKEYKVNKHLLGGASRESETQNFSTLYYSFEDFNQEDVAATMVLNFFKLRAKKPTLNIHLPARFNLVKEEKEYIIDMMEFNPYVTELVVNDDNTSLCEIENALSEKLARNRTLAAEEHRPAAMANYSRIAAELQLAWQVRTEPTELLTGKEHESRRKNVADMGVKGLQETLQYLQEDETSIRAMIGKAKSALYAACNENNYTDYIEKLATYLSQHEHFFPYAELGIQFRPGNDDKLINLMQQANSRPTLEKITLLDSMKNPDVLYAFLQQLKDAALAEGWRTPIVIPELDSIENLTKDTRELFSIYTLLNNIILNNRRTHAAESIIAEIQIQERAATSDIARTQVKSTTSSSVAETTDLFEGIKADKSWSLTREGGTQLQLQQQQEIKQEKKVRREQDFAQYHSINGALTSKLITYDNIDAELGGYYLDLRQQNLLPKAPKFALTKSGGSESPLQQWFRNWISANPDAKAPHAITSITAPAVKMLLQKHRHVTSGLNPENLPKGFYTQRDEHGHLVLCFDVKSFYARPKTTLTLDLDVTTPKATPWLGDFRQLNIEKYNSTEVAEDYLDDIIAFAAFQPEQDHTKDFNTFCQNNPGLKDAIQEHAATIKQHWLVFIQAWQYAGEAGIQAFIARSNGDLGLTDRHLAYILFQNIDGGLKTWIDSQNFNTAELRAIGHVFYHYGQTAISPLMNKFKQMNDTLGEDFFTNFRENFIGSCENLSSFISEFNFDLMQKIIIELQSKPILKATWQKIASKHVTALGWEELETLWLAFTHFDREVREHGLALNESQFDQLEPQNMLVCMDRILTCLASIPNQDKQNEFLSNLGDLDLSHGGILYAIHHEDFCQFDSELQLSDFAHGNPTYAPNLNDVDLWSAEEAKLRIKRVLATHSKFSDVEYRLITQRLTESLSDDNKQATINKLMLIMHTQYDDIGSALNLIDREGESLLKFGICLHQAYYQAGNRELNVSLAALAKLSQVDGFELGMLQNDSKATLLEAASMLHASERLDSSRWENIQPLLQLTPHFSQAELAQYHDHIKLASLFSIYNQKDIQTLIRATTDLKPKAEQVVKLLFAQLLSVDWENTTDIDCLNDKNTWDDLVGCINTLKSNLAESDEIRTEFVEDLDKNGIRFHYSISGNYRALNERKHDDEPEQLAAFVDHSERLREFLFNHVAIESTMTGRDALRPLIGFLKQLQLKRTYLNEIEPLLSALEKMGSGKYMSASYLLQLLKVLQPEDESSPYPVALFTAIVNNPLISARDLNAVEKNFPQELAVLFNELLDNTTFDRAQQILLCKLALKEFANTRSSIFVKTVVATLSMEQYTKELRTTTLRTLEQCRDMRVCRQRWQQCEWFLQQDPTDTTVHTHWKATINCWVPLLSNGPITTLYDSIKTKSAANKLAFIMHIIAWSSLDQGLNTEDAHQDELQRKAGKLIDRLATMSEADLQELAACYPQQPCPSADDVLRLIKQKNKDDSLSWADCLAGYQQTPHLEPRPDYGKFSATRLADLERMLADLRITEGADKTSLPVENLVRISNVFAHLKAYEDGSRYIDGYYKPIAQMSKQELGDAFTRLSEQSKVNPSDQCLAQIWAILFEVMGRTTRKYPHLAQQFALISNEICLTTNSKALQLATGEGKSHYSVLRAARYVGLGKEVDICTAKRDLAERDEADYRDFFNYLGIQTTYVTPLSERRSYVDSQVRFSTMGDLSLFLDKQSYEGHPIEINPELRVALLDEFDFIRFEENEKTQYNFALPIGKTPKQLLWVYQAVNQFYLDNQETLKGERVITVNMLRAFNDFLVEKAAGDEEKLDTLAQHYQDPLKLVRWLQAAHQTFALEFGVGFTVLDTNIQVGDETYPMREIIPLNSDNQKMEGASFSAGVQQLLAVRLNSEAMHKGEKQNHHIPMESNIVSSQIASERLASLWSIHEGFSGTISAIQANSLFKGEGTQVLHAPTNQRDLRDWKKPVFCESRKQFFDAIAEQAKACIHNKESMLFAWKNDRKVTEMICELETRLTPEEREQLIAFTNDSHETELQVLARKREAEAWHGGKKQKSISLVASRLGRGTNPGIEASLLPDVKDLNDRLQKGGRAARNGAPGCVYEFLVIAELQQEKVDLEQQFTEIKGADAELPDLPQAEGLSEHEALYYRVLRLREYVASLNNVAKQGFHAALAEFTTWGLKAISALAANEGTSEDLYKLRTSWSVHLKLIEQRWTDISSSLATPDVKIEHIRTEIKRQAESFHTVVTTDYPALNEFEGFEQREYKASTLELMQANEQIAQHAALTAKIAAHLSQLGLHELSDDRQAALIDNVGRVANAGDPKTLQRFHKQAMACTTISEVESACQIAIQPVDEILAAFNEFIEESGSLREFVQALTEGNKQRLLSTLGKLDKTLSAFALNAIITFPGYTPNNLIEQVLPILEYLAQLDIEGQQTIGKRYFKHLSNTLVDVTPEVMAACTSLTLMLPIDFQRIHNLAKRYSRPDEFEANLASIYAAVQANPEQRLRMLTVWEQWAHYAVDKTQLPDFFAAYCQAMQQFEEGVNWDIFESLVAKTSDWWNKGRHCSYQAELVSFWTNLSKHNHDTLLTIERLLNQGLNLSGKSWFQALGQVLRLDSEFLGTNLELIQHFLTPFAVVNDTKKHDKQTKLTTQISLLDLLQDTDVLPQLIGILREDQIDPRLLLELFTQLPDFMQNYFARLVPLFGEGLITAERLVNLHENLQDFTQQHPEFIEQLLQKLNDGVSIENLAEVYADCSLPEELYQHLIEQNHAARNFQEMVRQLKQAHAEIEPYTRRNEALKQKYLDAIKHSDARNNVVRILRYETLNAAMQASPEYAEHWLNHDGVFYLTTKVQAEHRRSVTAMMHELQALIQEKGADVEQIHHSDYFKGLFQVDGDEAVRQKRLSVLHMLNQAALVMREDEDNSLTHLGARWSTENNAELLQRGLSEYVRMANEILLDKPEQHRPNLVSDLTINQHQQLLRLSQELNVFSQYRTIPTIKDTDSSVRALCKSLSNFLHINKTVMHTEGRKQSANRLAERVEIIKSGRQREILLDNRYQKLLEAIDQQKYEVMRADTEKNKERTMLRKINHTGESPYFNTLGQMHDLVLRQWATDTQASHSFSKYGDYLQNHFYQLVTRINAEFIRWEENKDFSKESATKDRLALMNTTHQFLVDISPMVGNRARITARNLGEFMDKISQAFTDDSLQKSHYLNGSHTALVRQLINPGFALLDHLEYKAQDIRQQRFIHNART